MSSLSVTFTDATPEHFAEITAIEQQSSSASLVTFTAGHALQEALDRGHSMIVALEGERVVGWIWFTVDLGRGGEHIGQIFRIASNGTRSDAVGRALLERAQDALSERGCRLARMTLDGADDETRDLLETMGYTIDSVTMGREL